MNKVKLRMTQSKKKENIKWREQKENEVKCGKDAKWRKIMHHNTKHNSEEWYKMTQSKMLKIEQIMQS